MVIFNLRKKDWLDAKSQICFPGSKFAFPRTWPWSIMTLERGHFFSFFDFCDFYANLWFCVQGVAIRSDFFIVFSTLIHAISLWPKLKIEILHYFLNRTLNDDIEKNKLQKSDWFQLSEIALAVTFFCAVVKTVSYQKRYEFRCCGGVLRMMHIYDKHWCHEAEKTIVIWRVS